jgi:hypothetical protein
MDLDEEIDTPVTGQHDHDPAKPVKHQPRASMPRTCRQLDPSMTTRIINVAPEKH